MRLLRRGVSLILPKIRHKIDLIRVEIIARIPHDRIRALSLMHKLLLNTLVLLLALPAAGANVVLCVGADGHVSLEAARMGDCCQVASEQDRSFALPASSQRGCGNCADIRLGDDSEEMSVVVARAVAVEYPHLPLCSFRRVALADPIPYAPLVPPISHGTVSTAPIVHLRTVALLT